jgi:dolichol-phosphate mannosyltransferase
MRPEKMAASLSIVVPFYNEEECVRQVLDEIRTAQPGAEIIAIDDGSTDKTAAVLGDIPGLKVVKFGRNRGQSAALYAGLRAATGEIIAMMDGDGQNDPHDIGKLVAALDKYDVAYGVRAKRRDSFSRIIASRFANAIRRFSLGDSASDTGCSLKVIRREHVKFLVPFNGMHRYLPALFANSGLSAVEIEVNHRPRKTGVSKYTLGGRALRGIWDLIGVRWLLARRVDWSS